MIEPIASALVAHRDRYVGLLEEYCTGYVRPLVLAFSTETGITAAEARVTADRVVELRGQVAGRLREPFDPRAGRPSACRSMAPRCCCQLERTDS